jgi:hypothetical protein
MSINTPCTKCGSPASGKFCGVCGTPQPRKTVNCRGCGGSLAPAAKFCGICGTRTIAEEKASAPLVAVESSRMDSVDGFVSWSFLPGEIARKLSPDEIVEVANGGIQGFIVGEGQRALIYADGEVLAEVGPGKHLFLSAEEQTKIEEAFDARSGGVLGALSSISRAIGRFLLGSSRRERREMRLADYENLRSEIGRSKSVTVVIARSAPFLTKHVLQNVYTKDFTADFSLTLRVILGDLKSFYGEFLLDHKVVSQSQLEASLFDSSSGSHGHLLGFREILRNYPVKDLTDSQSTKQELATHLQELSPPALQVLQLLSVSAEKEELRRVREEQEANLIAEKEIENLINTNRIYNRFQTESNRRAIEEARGMEELHAAIQCVNTDGLLRREQFDNLVRDIRERAEDQSIGRGHALKMVQFRNDFDYQRQRLEFERQIVNRQLEINRLRQAEEAAHVLELDKNRRNFERDQDLQDLDVLKKLQSVKDEQNQREHDRALQAVAQSNAHQLDLVKQFAGMTAEQIMVANPNLTPEQAASMAEIAKSKIESSRQDDRVELLKEMQQSQEVVVAQFMKTLEGVMGQVTQAKDAEIKRTLQSTSESEERMMRVVNATVTSFGKAGQPAGASASERPNRKSVFVCKACSADVPEGYKFCVKCGQPS